MSDSSTVAASVIAQAKAKQVTIASCESLTGGAVGAALTEVPGASAAYLGGVITYATALKVKIVQVDAALAASEGVVNEQAARQMAEGALRLSGADFAVSTTGVAGPSGQDGRDPGEVWVGLAWRDDAVGVTSRAEYHFFSGGRGAIRAAAVRAALSLLENGIAAW